MLKNSVVLDKLEIIGNFGDSSTIHLPKDWQCKGISTDSRFIDKGNLFIALRGENSDGHKYIDKAIEQKAAAVMVDKDWYKINMNKTDSIPLIVVKNTLEALGRLANYHRRKFDFPIIAIGGSNGKTTTKELTANVLAQKYKTLKTHKNFNNQIGVPWMLFQLSDNYEIAVLEIGTNEPGEIALLSNMVEPTHGLITNIGKEHLEGFKDLEGVEIEEAFLFGFLYKTDGVTFINSDDQRLRKYMPLMENSVTFGTENEKMIKGKIRLNKNLNTIVDFFVEKEEFTAKLQTIGYASGLNAIAAAAVGFHFHLNSEQVKKGLESYRPDNSSAYGRMLLEKINGINIINDTYNANPDSMLIAFKSLTAFENEGGKYAVLGDMKELGGQSLYEHLNIISEISKIADNVFLYGQEMKQAYNALDNLDNVSYFDNKRDIVEHLKNYLNKNDLLLVKGSRGMAMEDIILELKTFFQ